ncbi:MAG: hypothetical protein EON54_01690 [Alcaligenaceae bacterium]|nr:MAG: hypothetical protein EON54_01690 [Alcaligenaceae bacterium]
MSHRNRRDGDSGLAAGGDDLSLELFAALAAAPARDDRVIFDSVHESTEKLSGLEAPMPSRKSIWDGWLFALVRFHLSHLKGGGRYRKPTPWAPGMMFEPIELVGVCMRRADKQQFRLTLHVTSNLPKRNDPLLECSKEAKSSCIFRSEVIRGFEFRLLSMCDSLDLRDHHHYHHHPYRWVA